MVRLRQLQEYNALIQYNGNASWAYSGNFCSVKLEKTSNKHVQTKTTNQFRYFND